MERAARVVLGLALIAFAALAVTHRWYNDDAFITFRYAHHIANGHGFVWNVVDGGPIEGSSSLAWTYLNTLGMKLAADPVDVSHGIGLVFALAGLLLVWRAARGKFNLAPWWALIPVLFLAGSRQWVLWSVSALETTAAATLVFAATLVMSREASRPGAGFVSGALYFTATLFRPEVPLLHLGAGLGLAFARRERGAWLAVLRSGAIHLVGLALLVAWRLAVFGRPLPNTFYAKVGGAQWALGFAYLGQFLAQTHAIFWLPLAAFGLWHTLRRRIPEAAEGRGLAAALAAQALLNVTWILFEGGDAWELRFFLPLFPAIALLVGVGATRIGIDFARPALAVGCAALAIVSQASTLFWLPLEYKFPVTAYDHLRATCNDRLEEGTQLEPYLGPADRIAYGWAGAMPYVTDAWHLDVWGLNDREIARRPFDPSGVLYHQRHATWDDIVERRVMFADIYNNFLFDQPYLPQQIRYPLMPWAKSGILVSCVELPEGRYRYWIFASPRPRDEIEAWLEKKGLKLRYSIPLTIAENAPRL